MFLYALVDRGWGTVDSEYRGDHDRPKALSSNLARYRLVESTRSLAKRSESASVTRNERRELAEESALQIITPIYVKVQLLYFECAYLSVMKGSEHHSTGALRRQWMPAVLSLVMDI